MESRKSHPSIVCFSEILVEPNHKGKHQILRNSKFQPLGSGLRFQITDRHSYMVFCNSSVEQGPVIPSSPAPAPGSWFETLDSGISDEYNPTLLEGKLAAIIKTQTYVAVYMSVEEAETVIDTVETVTDIVEKVAEQVKQVADKVGDSLPEGKLKDALEIAEDMAEGTVDDARIVGEFIDKVEDMVDQVEEELESLIKPNSGDDEEEVKEKNQKGKGHV
ncbi:hypothetical protein Gorai_012541 [Gossypium raimondii]|uniref:Uncharacterized protein n=1 Tax=Gossypium raimondii TaxID=29730 RepID=A0A7J8Q3E3_GOSRA|nr:hypothetical protein [Gossypium raimondii]